MAVADSEPDREGKLVPDADREGKLALDAGRAEGKLERVPMLNRSILCATKPVGITEEPAIEEAVVMTAPVIEDDAIEEPAIEEAAVMTAISSSTAEQASVLPHSNSPFLRRTT